MPETSHSIHEAEFSYKGASDYGDRFDEVCADPEKFLVNEEEEEEEE